MAARGHRVGVWRAWPGLLGVAVHVLACAPAGAQIPADVQRAARESQRIIQEEQQREQMRRREIEERVRVPSGQPVPPAAQAPQGPDGERCFTIRRIVLEGATRLSEADRRELFEPLTGKCVGLNEVNGLIQALTNRYVARGYTTTRVYLPEQDLGQGELRILVLEGIVEKIMLEGSGVNLGTAFPGVEGAIFNLRDFEQGLDQINRLRSNSAQIDVHPGAAPGASRVVIQNQPDKRWQLGLAGDNTGSVPTGRYQISAALGLDNPFQLNDYLNVALRANPDADEDRKLSRSISVIYTVPYGWWLFTGAASYFKHVSIVPGLVSEFQSSGSQRNQSLRAERVVFRDHARKWTLAGSVTRKETMNYLNGELVQVSSRDLAVADLASNLSVLALGGLWSFDLGYSQGLNRFGALEDPAGLPKAAPRAQFQKVVYGVNLAQPIPVGETVFSLATGVTGQYARDVLYGTEQILIGGPFSVRGFRENSISGDSGLFWRSDLGLPIPLRAVLGAAAPPGEIRPYLGYDVGHVAGKYGAPGGTLSSGTFGIDVRARPVTVQLAYSRPIDKPEVFRDRSYSYVRIAIDL